MSQSRLDRIRALMAERNLDALVISRPENRAYLSGFTGSTAWVLITAQGADLVTDFRYVEQAERESPAFQVVRATGAHYATLAELLAKTEASTIGFEGDFITFDEYGLYRDAMGSRQLVAATGLVESLRLVKDQEEQRLMAHAAEIADRAFGRILKVIAPGVVERDVAVELEYQMKKLGADGISFDIIVASGVRSSLPHGRASTKVIEAGNLVTLDFGALYQGYCSDMTRTVMVGEPTPKQREIYEIVLEAQSRGVAACRAGMTGKELDDVCRNYIAEKGYGTAFGHGTGHGVGRQIHEDPRVNQRGERQVLQPGMVVTIEPGIYLPGWGGVRIEDMVVVTETGCERLSKSPKDLVVL